MREYLKFYIDGQWVDPVEPRQAEVINPATEEVSGRIAMGSPTDIDKAVAAARRAAATAFSTSATPPSEIVPHASSVAGLMTFAVLGSAGSTH